MVRVVRAACLQVAVRGGGGKRRRRRWQRRRWQRRRWQRRSSDGGGSGIRDGMPGENLANKARVFTEGQTHF